MPAKAESPDGWARITTSKLSPGPLRPCSLEASESRDLTRSPAEPSRPAASLATVRPSLSWCAPEVRALFSRPLSTCWTRKNPRTVTTTTEITRVVATTRSWSERCQRRRICPATTRARRSSARRTRRTRGGSRRPPAGRTDVTRDAPGDWRLPRPGSAAPVSAVTLPGRLILPGGARPGWGRPPACCRRAVRYRAACAPRRCCSLPPPSPFFTLIGILPGPAGPLSRPGRAGSLIRPVLLYTPRRVRSPRSPDAPGPSRSSPGAAAHER